MSIGHELANGLICGNRLSFHQKKNNVEIASNLRDRPIRNRQQKKSWCVSVSLRHHQHVTLECANQ